MAQYVTNFQESVNICISSVVLFYGQVQLVAQLGQVLRQYMVRHLQHFFSETGNASLEDSKTRSHFGEGRRPLLPIYLH